MIIAEPRCVPLSFTLLYSRECGQLGSLVLVHDERSGPTERTDPIPPPLDRLAEVWNYLAQGKTPEVAAHAAGLLTRS